MDAACVATFHRGKHPYGSTDDDGSNGPVQAVPCTKKGLIYLQRTSDMDVGSINKASHFEHLKKRFSGVIHCHHLFMCSASVVLYCVCDSLPTELSPGTKKLLNKLKIFKHFKNLGLICLL